MRRTHPLYLLTVTAAVIFVAEGLVMLGLHIAASQFGALPPRTEGLLDAGMLTLLVFPVLYGMLFRPMRREMAGRMEAEQALRQAYDGLEGQVQERTRELGRANESLRAVMETAQDAIVSADSRGQVTYWNRQAAAIFGYPAGDILGHPLTLIMPERFRQAHTSGLQRLVSDGNPRVIGTTIELVGLRKDGAEFPIELSLARWMADGQAFFTAIIRDITERKQNQERLQVIFDEAPIGMVIVGRDKRFQQVNRRLCEMLGYAEEKLVGRTFMDITHPDDVAQDVALSEQLFDGAIPHYKLEKRYVKQDGQSLWVQLTAAVVQGPDGKPLYGLGLIEDIMDRKQWEGTLKRERDQLARLNDIMMDREERVLEMKREVNALLQELGRPPQYQA